MGVLYLVATPIGNLEDMSPRAIRILKQAQLIAAEDTRHSGKLLQHFGISTRMLSYHEHNKLRRLDEVLAALAQGDVAVISDAGTPALNDPGYELVRAALHAGYPVCPVPGPSAPLAALVASGLPTDSFLYLGYPPRRQKERRQWLAEIAGLRYTLVCLESPHRIVACLADMLQVLGDRPACAARELTKMYEEIFRGSLSTALAHFSTAPPRGEFTLVIGGAPAGQEKWSLEQIQQAIAERGQAGLPMKTLAAELAVQSGWSRREVYRLIVQQAQSKK